MVEKNNAVCSICGSPYHLCLSCKDSMKLHPWKIHCCSSECYKTFQIVKGFKNGVYTKEEAKNKFKNVDLNNLKNFIPRIKKVIEEILKEEQLAVDETIVYRRKNYKIEKANTNEEIDKIVEDDEVINKDVDEVVDAE